MARSELTEPLTALEPGVRTMGKRRGERWELVAEPLTDGGPESWRFAMAVPLEPVLAAFDRIRRSLAFGAAGALLLAVLAGTVLARGLAGPIRTLVRATVRVGRGEYDTRVPEESEDEVGQLARAFNEMTEGLALKEQYRGVLDKVVSPDVAAELMRGELTLGGESREVTVLFADIRGFTAITEGMPPQGVIALLNETMAALGNAVERAGGVVDKYVGDEIMAVFGAPLVQRDHARRAVRAALDIQEAMGALGEDRVARGAASVAVGVGLHTGEAVAGNMGSPSRLNYTVVGESVNLASRLFSAAGPGEILTSGVTRGRLAEAGVSVDGSAQGFVIRAAGSREMKGFRRSVDVYEIVARPEDAAARPGGSTARAATLPVVLLQGALATAMAAGLAWPAPAAAQALPTLRDAGLEWISEDGAVQLGLSGRMDLEGYLPGDSPPWIIPETSAFVAGRARLFADLFAGRYVQSSVELRVDRGEEPRAGPLEARMDQAFVRLGPLSAGSTVAASVQLGKFVSAFGGWAQRHHTTRDPFVRPPIMYDHRTMVIAGIAPGSTAGFVAWKDDIPRDFRPIGAPPMWGAPYQWGAMLMGGGGPLAFRAAAMNSAPSSEPEAWAWDADRLRRPSWVAHLGYQLSPALRLGGSYNRGPYLETPVEGALNAGREEADYVQELFGVEAVIARGGLTLRGEALADRWEVPNVPEDAWDLSYYVEGQYDVAAGAYVAARWGAIWFNELGEGDGGSALYGGSDDLRWDYNVRRLQLAAGYRVARDVGVQAEYMLNGSDDPAEDSAGSLLSLQLWWQY